MKFKNIAIAFATFGLANYLYKKSKNNLSGKWIIKEGWFGNDEILLEKLNEKENKDLSIVLTFEENNNLLQYLHNPYSLEIGNMGRLHFTSASWELNDNEIIFDIEGAHVATNTFHYHISYTFIQSPQLQ